MRWFFSQDLPLRIDQGEACPSPGPWQAISSLPRPICWSCVWWIVLLRQPYVNGKSAAATVRGRPLKQTDYATTKILSDRPQPTPATIRPLAPIPIWGCSTARSPLDIRRRLGPQPRCGAGGAHPALALQPIETTVTSPRSATTPGARDFSPQNLWRMPQFFAGVASARRESLSAAETFALDPSPDRPLADEIPWGARVLPPADGLQSLARSGVGAADRQRSVCPDGGGAKTLNGVERSTPGGRRSVQRRLLAGVSRTVARPLGSRPAPGPPARPGAVHQRAWAGFLLRWIAIPGASWKPGLRRRRRRTRRQSLERLPLPERV